MSTKSWRHSEAPQEEKKLEKGFNNGVGQREDKPPLVQGLLDDV